MFCNSDTIRYLLTAVLTISAGLVGVSPQLANATAIAERQTPKESPAADCCCGTQTGNCCKAGLCNSRNAPVPERSPLPTPGASRVLVLALVHSQFIAPSTLLGAQSRDTDSDMLSRSLAESTLQAAYVRLDT